MKKLFLAAMLALASFVSMPVAQAADDLKSFGKIEYAFRDVDANADNKNGANITIGREVAPGVKFDLKTEFRRENGSGNTSNRFEVGGTMENQLSDNTRLFVRGAVGEKFISGAGNDDFAYYSLEPGVKVGLSKDLTLIGSYRFRDSFSGNDSDETHRVRVGGEYALSNATFVTADVARSLGDTQYNSVNVGYGFRF